jgi:hypothetical protein
MFEQMPCPNCGQRRGLKMTSGVYFCMGCRQKWAGLEPAVGEESFTNFTCEQWTRLEVYRRAAAAGFYSEW